MGLLSMVVFLGMLLAAVSLGDWRGYFMLGAAAFMIVAMTIGHYKKKRARKKREEQPIPMATARIVEPEESRREREHQPPVPTATVVREDLETPEERPRERERELE